MQEFKNKTFTSTSILIVLLISHLPLHANNRMEKADSLFSLRNENFDSKHLLAKTIYVDQAINIYKDILTNSTIPKIKAEALWKLEQSFYFKGEFCSNNEDIKEAIFKEGINIGEKYIIKVTESAEAYMWLGILWAKWGEVTGIIPAARDGAADKIKEYAEKTIIIDNQYLGAGGYRLLGTVHISAPYVPFILTWPSDKEGLINLEKAYKIAPNNLYNKMYLAMALHENDQNDRAKSLLMEIINTKGIIHDLAIDLYIKRQAKDYLSNEF